MTNWIGWMLGTVVLLLLFVAAAIMLNPVCLLVMGQRTDGMVVGMNAKPGLPGESANETTKALLIEFVTSAGDRVRIIGRSYSWSPSVQVGDAVSVAYSRANPRNAQILTLSEFPLGPAGIIIGFALLMILIWISGILISGDSRLDDPFHFLPVIISHFRLNPFRFPLLFLLSVVIPICGSATYIFSRQAVVLHYNGIKAVGTVTGFVSKKNSDNMLSSDYPQIAFEDISGKSYTILGSAKNGPLSSPLKIGESVEVIYLISHPDKGILNSWDELYLFPLFFGFMTFAFLVLLHLEFNGAIRL